MTDERCQMCRYGVVQGVADKAGVLWTTWLCNRVPAGAPCPHGEEPEGLPRYRHEGKERFVGRVGVWDFWCGPDGLVLRQGGFSWDERRFTLAEVVRVLSEITVADTAGRQIAGGW